MSNSSKDNFVGGGFDAEVVGRFCFFCVAFQKRDYFVSEKTDGVRYFLVVASGKAVMVDRSNCPFTTSGTNIIMRYDV